MTPEEDYHDRDELDVAILDALVDRSEEGMTIFELRTHVSADIDDLETALQNLNEDGLIIIETTAQKTDRAVIKPAPAVVPSPSDAGSESFLDRIRRWLGL